jgi:hypothetical protein
LMRSRHMRRLPMAPWRPGAGKMKPLT